jgi:hypothetical protein
MTKPFNIHDWQAKQRLAEQRADWTPPPMGMSPGEKSQEYMPNEIIKSLQVAVSNHSINKILNNLAVIIDKTGKHDEADMIKKLASQIQDFEDEDEMHDDPGDIRIDHDYYTEQNATGTGASFNAGSGAGYMSPKAFGKKKDKDIEVLGYKKV